MHCIRAVNVIQDMYIYLAESTVNNILSLTLCRLDLNGLCIRSLGLRRRVDLPDRASAVNPTARL